MNLPLSESGFPRGEGCCSEPIAWWKLGLIISFGLAIRMYFFTGMSYGDDGIYAAQAIGHACLGSWPPVKAHWQTRIGFTVPIALSIRLFGTERFAFVLWPLLASLIKIIISFLVARDFTDLRTAYLSACLQAFFPLDVIYATQLFPDTVTGLFSTISIWYWIRALRNDRGRDFVLAGFAFAVSYLCRETVILDGGVYVALWVLAGRFRRPQLLWVFVIPVLVLVAEMSLYSLTAGSLFYRWAGILTQVSSPANVEIVGVPKAGGNFLTDPLIMAVASHEFGAFMGLSLILAVAAMWKRSPLCPLGLWLVVGFLCLYYATTSPTRWIPLDRDPRYAASLTVPCVILLAQFLNSLPALLRASGIVILIGSGIVVQAWTKAIPS